MVTFPRVEDDGHGNKLVVGTAIQKTERLRKRRSETLQARSVAKRPALSV
jgi:hypothetical protein